MSEATWPEIHLHFHAPAENSEVLNAIAALSNQQAQETQTVMADLTALTAAVTNNTTVDESAIALLNQLGDLIRQNATDPAALAALADQLDSESANLAAAVTANTPAA